MLLKQNNGLCWDAEYDNSTAFLMSMPPLQLLVVSYFQGNVGDSFTSVSSTVGLWIFTTTQSLYLYDGSPLYSIPVRYYHLGSSGHIYSCLRVINRFYRYNTLHLWTQLPELFRMLHAHLSALHYYHHAHTRSHKSFQQFSNHWPPNKGTLQTPRLLTASPNNGFTCQMHQQHWTDYVYQWVSLSHKTSWTLYTGRNLPPIFTKLATKVESREMWLPIVLWKSEICMSAKPEVELIFVIVPMEK